MEVVAEAMEVAAEVFVVAEAVASAVGGAVRRRWISCRTEHGWLSRRWRWRSSALHRAWAASACSSMGGFRALQHGRFSRGTQHGRLPWRTQIPRFAARRTWAASAVRRTPGGFRGAPNTAFRGTPNVGGLRGTPNVGGLRGTQNLGGLRGGSGLNTAGMNRLGGVNSGFRPGLGAGGCWTRNAWGQSRRPKSWWWHRVRQS